MTLWNLAVREYHTTEVFSEKAMIWNFIRFFYVLRFSYWRTGAKLFTWLICIRVCSSWWRLWLECLCACKVPRSLPPAWEWPHVCVNNTFRLSSNRYSINLKNNVSPRKMFIKGLKNLHTARNLASKVGFRSSVQRRRKSKMHKIVHVSSVSCPFLSVCFMPIIRLLKFCLKKCEQALCSHASYG